MIQPKKQGSKKSSGGGDWKEGWAKCNKGELAT